jgi:hypothetical protein
MVSALLYISESIFLGAVSREWKAHQAFPNAKKVILKVCEPSDRLEGESIPKVLPNLETSEDSHLHKDIIMPTNAPTGVQPQ